eukprot:gene1282-12108_t
MQKTRIFMQQLADPGFEFNFSRGPKADKNRGIMCDDEPMRYYNLIRDFFVSRHCQILKKRVLQEKYGRQEKSRKRFASLYEDDHEGLVKYADAAEKCKLISRDMYEFLHKQAAAFAEKSAA